MTGINHVLTGVAIGAAIQEPILVIPLALASHFALDMLPHFGNHPVYKWGHRHFWKILAVDSLLSIGAIVAAIIVAPSLAWPIILGGIFAALPDFLWVDFFGRGNRNHWFHKFHKKIQWYEHPPGAIVEVVFLMLASGVIVSLI